MINKLGIVVLTLAVAIAWSGTGYAEQSSPQDTGQMDKTNVQSGGQPGTPTGPTTGTQPKTSTTTQPGTTPGTVTGTQPKPTTGTQPGTVTHGQTGIPTAPTVRIQPKVMTGDETKTPEGTQTGQPIPQPDKQMSQPLETQPGGPVNQPPSIQSRVTAGGKTVIGTVRSIDPSRNTLTIELSRDFGSRKKGEQLTFDLMDPVRWEGTQRRSLSDLKPGDLVEFEVRELVYYIRVKEGEF